MARWSRGAVAVLVLLAAHSCALVGNRGEGDVVEKGGRFVLVAPEDISEAGVGFAVSRLRLVGDCVGLDFGDGRTAVAIWPHGTEWVSTQPLAIDVPGLGRVDDGDALVGGGTDYEGPHPLSGIEVPSTCRAARLVSFTPQR